MDITCLIVDDEPAAIRVVENYLEKMSYINISGKCKSAFEAIQFLNDNTVDLLFLDINMPGLSGIEFLKSLRNPPLVIITTAYREYAVESFDLEVIDYLHKPFSFDRFYRAVQRAEETLKLRNSNTDETQSKTEDKDIIFIKSDKKYLKIKYADLLYIESMGDYCKIITNEARYLSYLTLKKLIEILPDNFIRVHKSFIVQIDKIEQVEGNIITISKSKIPIGFSYKNEVNKLLNF